MNETLALFRNVFWLLLSFILALFIWIFASFQRDPIVQRSFIQVPVAFHTAENMLLLEEPRRSVTVFIRAPESNFSRFTRDDIAVHADLRTLDRGDHLVPLQVEIAHQHSVSVDDVLPSEIRVQLDQDSFRQLEIELIIEGELLPGYLLSDATLKDVEDVVVYGPTSELEAIASVVARLPLHEQRNSFHETVDLLAIDDAGETIADVRIQPEQITVSVVITARDDIHQIAVHQPSLDFGSLPWGYYPSSIQYEPQYVFVSGTPELLASLPEFLSTEKVDLSDRTEDFAVEVPIILPAGLAIVEEKNTILVEIGIEAQEGYREFADVPVNIVGLPDGFVATLNPENVSMYLAGPLPILRHLDAEQIVLELDVSELNIGYHSISPTASIPSELIEHTSFSIVPALVELELRPANEN